MQSLEFIRKGRETRRFHTNPVLHEQNVAEHSFGVAMLVWVLAGSTEPGVRLPLLMAALTHDLAEHSMGADMASPAKRAMPDVYDATGERLGSFREVWGAAEQAHLQTVQLDFEFTLSAEEKRILKLADAMEGALYCIRERAMGNKLIEECFINFRLYICDLVEHPVELEVLNYIDASWEKANG